MANVDPKGLAQSLTNLTRGDSSFVQKASVVHTNLVDSLYNFETTTGTPISASTSTTLPKITIPAKSVIIDYGVVVTETINGDTGTFGTKIGTTSGGGNLVTTDADNLETSAETVRAGTGSFIDPTITANLGGQISLTASNATQYVATETDVFVTITTTGGFDGDGEVTGIIKYIKL
jgi:hypothetical protein